jgi:4-hydroxy-tetrahydrodipicolinate synthase
MVQRHIHMGVNGLFLAGTNGEGPWMPDTQRRRLVTAAVKYTEGRMLIAVQVTDNSTARILANIAEARDDGADIAVIAPPYFNVAGRPDTGEMYLESIRHSPLPIGLYDRGRFGPIQVPDSALEAALMEKKVILLKDSSDDPLRRRIALRCRRRRPQLRLLTGCEFNCVEYLKAGFDGLLLGGGVFNGFLAHRIIAAVQEGHLAQAEKLQARMNRIMYGVYGGRKFKCWLAGEKKLLVEMGIFRTWKNYPNFPLTASCRKAITRTLVKDRDALLP